MKKTKKNNYIPIELVTAAYKIFNSVYQKFMEDFLCTHGYQFGFKSKYSIDLCIYTVKSVFKCYILQNSETYTCFLDASKAFDKINHWTLSRGLIDFKTPTVIVRILHYSTVFKVYVS